MLNSDIQGGKNQIIEFSTQCNTSPIENANKPFFEVSLFALQTL